MFKPLPTSPTSARSSHSGGTRSRPLTASSRASELSYFSQYSVDELARRIFFPTPGQDEGSDGTVYVNNFVAIRIGTLCQHAKGSDDEHFASTGCSFSKTYAPYR